MCQQEFSESVDLFRQIESGDDEAASELFQRYFERLIAIVRSHFSAQLRGRLDPEDIAMSAWRSFFVGAHGNAFCIQHSGELWSLLVSIALRKLFRQVRRHRSQKRDLLREQRPGVGSELEMIPDDGVPTPEEAVALAEEVELVLKHCDPLMQQIVQLRLQDYSHAEIATAIGRSERTVRRAIATLRKSLTQRLGSLAGDETDHS